MSKQTVYVIGAGASYEVGLPVGNDLKDNIANLLNIEYDGYSQIRGDHLINSVLSLVCPNTQDDPLQGYLNSAWQIRDALPLAISIDNFLDSQRGNPKIELCGKLGIVRAILQAEKGSLLFYQKKEGFPLSINFKMLEETWYLDFFKTLTESCTKNDLDQRFSHVSLIVFNYDRCIQHFLYHALQTYYNLSEEEASKLVLSINIIHPYGSVGALPWKHHDEGQQMEFGAEPGSRQLLELAKRIKTFTEGHDQESKGQIEKVIDNCERLVFLGFAFHKLNMELIKPSVNKDMLKVKGCYATTYGMSESNQQEIMKILNGTYNQPYTFNQEDSFAHAKAIPCRDFFSEYSFELSFS